MDVNCRHRAENLSVQQMQTFCSVYELGGYANAEKQLGLAGPTMWEHVKSLEKTYRTALFERCGRSIQPTEAGTTLYRILRPIVVGIESSIEVLGEGNMDAKSRICLVTGVRMMFEELGKPLHKFSKQHRGIEIRLKTADNRTAQEAIVDGEADLAVLIEPPPDSLLPGIEVQRLYPVDYLAVFPKRHRLASVTKFSLGDFASEPLIVGNPNTTGRQALERAMFRLGLLENMRIAVETDNSAITIACVQAGLGVGIIAGNPKGNLTRHLLSRSLAVDLGQVSVVAAYRSGRQLTHAVQQLIDLLSCHQISEAAHAS